MLQIKQLHKRFGENDAVKDLTITLEKGQVLGLLGRNGAGKTTTIKMMLGLLTPTSGEILWDGKPIGKADVSIGYLPEERGLYQKSKVSHQLRYFAQLDGISVKEADKQIDYWLDKLQITEYKNKRAGQLSKGNQQKIQLIATLLHNPQLIILDEPFSGLDPVNANVLAEIIEEEIAKGKTVIFSSHRMEQVESFCDYVCIMKQGESVVQGSLREIKRGYGYRNLILENTKEITHFLDVASVTYEIKLNDLYVRVKDEEEALKLLTEIQREKIAIRYFKLLEPTLNDIFIERAK